VFSVNLHKIKPVGFDNAGFYKEKIFNLGITNSRTFIMTHATPAHNPNRRAASTQTSLPVEVAIALTTAPLLIVLVGTKVLSNTMQDLGRWSEELFRGDRLPLLNLQSSSPPSSNTGQND
jgi:hypothetical protein